ncbi:MAG: DUF3108 domain-containing protein [Candidatus Latescibacterota bacterium]
MKGVWMNKSGSILGVVLLTACFGGFADEAGSRSQGKPDSSTGMRQDEPAVAAVLAAAPAAAVTIRNVPELKGREMTPDMEVKYPSDRFVPRVVSNNSWGVGEHLVFTVDYGFYKAGTATMSVVGTDHVNGGLCYRIQTNAESNDFISKMYRVRYKVESYIDVRGLFSRRFEKKLREGGYKSDEYVDIHQDRLIALSTKEKRALVEVPLYVQDILSTLYYIRTLNLQVGKTETIETYADGKVYPLKVFVHKKEKVEVPAGTFMCYQVEPKLKSEGIFRQKGKLLVWLTDDQYRMPVKMTSKVTIGNIATKLESYKKAPQNEKTL